MTDTALDGIVVVDFSRSAQTGADEQTMLAAQPSTDQSATIQQSRCRKLGLEALGVLSAKSCHRSSERLGVTSERAEGVCKYIQLRREELDERFPGLMESVLSAPATPAP